MYYTIVFKINEWKYSARSVVHKLAKKARTELQKSLTVVERTCYKLYFE